MIDSVIKNRPFRYWCQKVLPLVYDDSLSYYELLCKVVDYINGLLKDDENVINKVNELEQYINDYFTNLNVQTEINNKLDVMVENGQLDEVISHYVDPYINAQNLNIEEFKTTVNNRFVEQGNDMSVLEARMDTFASLPTGSLSTNADAELVDIRVGADGRTYDTAGNAVRGQLTDIKNVYKSNLYENILPYPYYEGTSKTINGITFTVNTDGTITADGTATTNATFNIVFSAENKTINPGQYVLSGNPDSEKTYIFAGARGSSADIMSLQNISNPVTASISESGTLRVSVVVRSGMTVSDAIFRPMLQRGSLATDFISPSAKYVSSMYDELKKVTSHTAVQRGFTLDKFTYPTKTDASGWMTKCTYPAGYIDHLRIKMMDASSGYVVIVGAESDTVLFKSQVTVTGAGIIDVPVNRPFNEPVYIGVRIANVSYISTTTEPQYDYTNSIPTLSELPKTNIGEHLSLTWRNNMHPYLAIEAVYSDAYTASISGMPSLSEYNLAHASFSMFPTFGVIGDSYASGEIFTGPNSAVDSYYLSWGQNIARQNGIRCVNYSQGGMDTRKFVNYSSAQPGSLARLLSDDPLNMYMLALGINDPTNNGGVEYLGSIADITSYESYTAYPDTFYGNYGKIIEQIQNHAPNAKIIMITTPHTDYVRTQFNDAIEVIAKHYGIPCMVQLENDFLKSDLYWNTMFHGHPTAVTYSAMAMAFSQMFGKCCYEYYEYFKDYILPTDFPTN